MIKQKTSPKNKGKESVSSPRELILHNDEINTFDFVIQSLIEVCKHEPEQAEQCAMIVHCKGKCTVKTAPYAELEPIGMELSNRGLSATIL